MKDRKGNELAVGDRVFVIPDKQDGDDFCGQGLVRKFSRADTVARVDDGPADCDICRDKNWTWSSWVESWRLEKI